MSLDITKRLQDLANRGTSSNFDINTAIFREAPGGTISGNVINDGSRANSIFQNILSGNGIPNSFDEELQNQNLVNLGQSQIDFSTALNENIAIRESQRAETFDAINGLAAITGEINKRLSGQVSQLGQSLDDAANAQGHSVGAGLDDLVNFFTRNPVALGLGAGGLIAAGVLIFLVIK